MSLSASLRRALKRRVPHSLVTAVRRFVDGPGIETQVLRPWSFVPDPAPGPRLTLVLPGIGRSEAFGGVMTGLEFLLALGLELAARADVSLRILTEAPYDPADSALARLPGAERVAVESLATQGDRVPARAREIFLVYNWWCALNIEPVLRAQAAHWGRAYPKFYLVQEYEPHFYEFSSAHLLALHAFNASWPTEAIVNSAELLAYIRQQGDRFAQTYLFEPRLPPALRPFLDGLDAAERTRTILVYGRPQIARNAFSILQRGLELWAGRPEAQGWRVVSAGLKHADIPLGAGLRLVSLGKLPLDSYGKLLRQTAVGISLMSSPHPSYPPLEMAHFGIRTLTNRYPCKDLAQRHGNIVSLPDVLPETLAETLAATCAAFDADPGGGLAAPSHMPAYLSGAPFECLGAVAGRMAVLLGPAA